MSFFDREAGHPARGPRRVWCCPWPWTRATSMVNGGWSPSVVTPRQHPIASVTTAAAVEFARVTLQRIVALGLERTDFMYWVIPAAQRRCRWSLGLDLRTRLDRRSSQRSGDCGLTQRSGRPAEPARRASALEGTSKVQCSQTRYPGSVPGYLRRELHPDFGKHIHDGASVPQVIPRRCRYRGIVQPVPLSAFDRLRNASRRGYSRARSETFLPTIASGY
jgi:hypothetical protein